MADLVIFGVVIDIMHGINVAKYSDCSELNSWTPLGTDVTTFLRALF